jgi:DNA-binding LacI/PurR family transcriptional regulator
VSGYLLAKDLIRKGRVTAVFCANDQMAFGAIRAAKEVGLTVPDDLSVVGFDNIPFSAYYNPSLTTVGIPMYDVGVAAVEMFIHRSLKKDTAGLRRFDTQLLVRDSTAKRKRASRHCVIREGMRKNAA